MGRPALAAGHSPYDQKRFGRRCDSVGQRVVRMFVRQVSRAGEEPDEGSALLCDVIANRSAQHRVAGLKRVENRALRHQTLDVETDLAVDARELPQVRRQHNADHESVWTSTESTAGRSRTMGAQLSPASADPYTCPPVVPKYTPHESSASTAIASRNTFT